MSNLLNQFINTLGSVHLTLELQYLLVAILIVLCWISLTFRLRALRTQLDDAHLEVEVGNVMAIVNTKELERLIKKGNKDQQEIKTRLTHLRNDLDKLAKVCDKCQTQTRRS